MLKAFLLLVSWTSLAAASQAQCELQKVHPDDGGEFQILDVEGDLAITRAERHVYLYELTPSGWVVMQELLPSDAPDMGLWGGAEIDGDRIAVVVSATFALGNYGVYVFERPGPGAAFVEAAKLVPSVPLVDPAFDKQVALDGDLLVLGNPMYAAVPSGIGSAHVFERAAGQWSEVLEVSGAGFPWDGSGLGVAVGISKGSVLIQELGWSTVAPAGVSVYQKLGGSWFKTEFLPSDAGGFDAQGGRLVLVEPGLARIYHHTASGFAELASLPVPGGFEASLHGSTLAIGDPLHDATGPGSGAVHVFEESGGVWSQNATLVPQDSAAGMRFGSTVAVEGDLLLAAASFDDDAGPLAGAVYAWSLSGQGCPSLTADLYGIPSATSGVQTLRIAPGPAFSGDFYLVAGSLSGIWPGLVIAGETIPLNPDAYLEHTLFHGGSPPLVGPSGFLDGAGEATAQVALPADPQLAGLTAHHAFGVVDASFQLVHVSNAVPLVVP